ncbi:MAG: hypothetical protein PWQ38_530 [Proteiniphilum sp.]|jgi:hypothetical protein|nr:hypothetical protein [Proteiniphilum sp.]
MKRFIIIAAMVGLFVVNLRSQHQEHNRLPWDSIPRELPPFTLEGIDTLRFHPGDTIPAPIWKQFLKKQGRERARALPAPMDQMPVVVPPGYTFHMIVKKPDTTFLYHSRNLREEEKKSLRLKTLPGKKKR